MDTFPLASSTAKKVRLGEDPGPGRIRLDHPESNDQDIQEHFFLKYRILVGRNAPSNDNLVKNHPHKGCYWFHALGAPGPHVILCINGMDLPADVVLRRAASFAILPRNAEVIKQVRISTLMDVFKLEESAIGSWKTWRKETIDLS